MPSITGPSIIGLATAEPPPIGPEVDTTPRPLPDLYASEINASISLSWFWDAGIDVALGDELNGIVAGGQVATLAQAAEWLRASAVRALPGQ